MTAGEERRATCQLIEFWGAKRDHLGHPPSIDLDLRNVISHIYPFHFFLRISEHIQSVLVESAAQIVTEICSTDPIGKPVDQALPWPLSENMPHLAKALAEYKLPIGNSGSIAVNDREAVYRAAMVPLSTNGGTVDRILGTINYRFMDG